MFIAITVTVKIIWLRFTEHKDISCQTGLRIYVPRLICLYHALLWVLLSHLDKNVGLLVF